MDIIYNEDAMRYETEQDGVIYCTADGKPEELTGAKEKLCEMLPRIGDIDREARRCAADELLETKNGAWLEKDEAPLTAEDFMNRLQLTEVVFEVVGEEGGIFFWYDDDDMFCGHTVSVLCDLDGKVEFAEMMG